MLDMFDSDECHKRNSNCVYQQTRKMFHLDEPPLRWPQRADIRCQDVILHTDYGERQFLIACSSVIPELTRTVYITKGLISDFPALRYPVGVTQSTLCMPRQPWRTRHRFACLIAPIMQSRCQDHHRQRQDGVQQRQGHSGGSENHPPAPSTRRPKPLS